MITSILTAVLLQSAPPATNTNPPSPPPPCASEEHGGFDFWVGTWDVYPTGSDSMVGQSRIERTHNGCAVIENWMPANGRTGSSLNHYDPASGQWHQKWVGSGGGAVEFTGGVTGGKMVLTGNWPSPQTPHQLIRMTYTANDDGSVRQFGEGSTDHGLTWSASFDFIYRPRQRGGQEISE
ncbi:hypothetical protein [Pontixanthobacter luteolus]|uniref:hypothetical protein n=1 Tax=Pontixanthobacter luteolus TaxID=295089 RepID=UPI0023036E63|nr:hypothetical protein [Pontixanthobacter luteolus]